MAQRIRLYIDESGDHRLPKTGDGFERRYLSIVGVMFPMDGPIHGAIEALKSRHFAEHHRDDPVCLHRREIINATGPFACLKEPTKRERFNSDLLALLHEQPFVVFGVVVDKLGHEARQNREAKHPYDYALRLMLERYSGRLLHKGHTGDVMAEARGGREDTLLRAEYQRVYTGGTQYHSAQQFQRALTSKELKLKSKEANIAGLQIADILARDVLVDTLLRKGIAVPDPTPFCRSVIDVLQSKYNRNTSSKRIDGYGRVLI